MRKSCFAARQIRGGISFHFFPTETHSALMNGVREDMVWRVAMKELLEREEIFEDLLYSTKVQHLDCPHLCRQSVYFAMKISNNDLACWNTALYTTKWYGVSTLRAI